MAYTEPEINLSAGHTHLVRFNEETKNPRIGEVLMEVIEGEAQTQSEEPADWQ